MAPKWLSQPPVPVLFTDKLGLPLPNSTTSTSFYNTSRSNHKNDDILGVTLFSLVGLVFIIYQVYRTVSHNHPRLRLKNLRAAYKDRKAHARRLSIGLDDRPELPPILKVSNSDELQRELDIIQYDSRGTTLEGSFANGSTSTSSPTSVRSGDIATAAKDWALEPPPMFNDRPLGDLDGHMWVPLQPLNLQRTPSLNGSS